MRPNLEIFGTTENRVTYQYYETITQQEADYTTSIPIMLIDQYISLQIQLLMTSLTRQLEKLQINLRQADALRDSQQQEITRLKAALRRPNDSIQ
jgi:hypothetical protein